MPDPTRSKKQSLMPSSPLRRKLRAAGHHLAPVILVGKGGLNDAVLRELSKALDAHELVKVKVGTESPEDRFAVGDRIASGARAQVAQILGRTVLAYRKHPRQRRYEEGPLAPEAEATEPDRKLRGRRAAGRRSAVPSKRPVKGAPRRTAGKAGTGSAKSPGKRPARAAGRRGREG